MEQQEHITLHNNFRAISGLSLIELLVAMLLSSIVMLGLYNILISQNRTYTVQDEIGEMQQNLRVAMERISRDLQMSGFGKPWWATISGVNLGSPPPFSVRITGGNSIEIVGCLDPAAASLNTAVAANSTSLVLRSGEGAKFNTTTKADISIEGRENARIIAISGNKLTIDRSPGTGGNEGVLYSYPANSKVYLVHYTTYTVDTSSNPPTLVMDEHQGSGNQSVATNISAMSANISANFVKVTLTGRTRSIDRTTGQYGTAQLTNEIHLRNR
jgi:prepilin-type N-terminal cleavage/methylation domain-containing protein